MAVGTATGAAAAGEAADDATEPAANDQAGGAGDVAASAGGSAEALATGTGASARGIWALDRLVHEPARLAILVVLANAEEVDFKFMQAATGLSKGNLSRQASTLEAAGYVDIRKYYRGKLPATGFRLTPAGRLAFDAYWEQMAALQRRLTAGAEPAAGA